MTGRNAEDQNEIKKKNWQGDGQKSQKYNQNYTKLNTGTQDWVTQPLLKSMYDQRLQWDVKRFWHKHNVTSQIGLSFLAICVISLSICIIGSSHIQKKKGFM